jgi:hypothetical protein
MKTLKTFLNEFTTLQMNDVEKFADKLFASLGIDVEFTKHFKERLNDRRNKKEINPTELIRLFRQTFNQHKDTIKNMELKDERVITDLVTNLNLPFTLTWDSKNNEIDLISKTIMRKKNFRTRNQKIILK